IHEAGVAAVCLGDLLEEARANDTAATPDAGDGAEVERPVVFLLRLRHELQALSIRTDLRGIERAAYRLDQLGLGATVSSRRPLQHLGGGNALLFQRPETAREHGLGNGV